MELLWPWRRSDWCLWQRLGLHWLLDLREWDNLAYFSCCVYIFTPTIEDLICEKNSSIKERSQYPETHLQPRIWLLLWRAQHLLRPKYHQKTERKT